jgi:hypothetical protein
MAALRALRPAVGLSPIAAAGTILCYAVELDQHFVHKQVNAGNAFDFYTAARNTIATGVIEAVIRPVGFNSPVPALTSN